MLSQPSPPEVVQPYAHVTPSSGPMHYYSTPLPFAQHTGPAAVPSEDSLPLPFTAPRQSALPSPPVMSAGQHNLPSPSVHTAPAPVDYHSQVASSYSPTLPAYSAPQYPQQPAAQPAPPPEEEVSLMSFQRVQILFFFLFLFFVFRTNANFAQAYEDPVILRNNLLKSLTERTQQRLKTFYSTTTKEIEELMETNQVRVFLYFYRSASLLHYCSN